MVECPRCGRLLQIKPNQALCWSCGWKKDILEMHTLKKIKIDLRPRRYKFKQDSDFGLMDIAFYTLIIAVIAAVIITAGIYLSETYYINTIMGL